MIHAFMVVRNEEHRYLQSCLSWLKNLVDDIFIYDDHSTDGSVALARSMGAEVIRSLGRGTFMEHEGNFKNAAWSDFEAVMAPTERDWILAIDADEFLISSGNTYLELRQAMSTERTGVLMDVPELWSLDPPYVRTDGYWAKNRLTRFFAYRENGRFEGKSMGCGSCPTYVAPGRADKHLKMLHVGYADETDRLDKYKRYKSLLDHGHSNSHIESIVEPPTLHGFGGEPPEIWRGVR